MKKVLLINSPAYNTGDERIFIPLGICYLAASLRNNGYYCDVLDANLEYPSVHDIVNYAVNYDLVGLSTNTINFEDAVEIAKGIKQRKKIPVLLGGHHSTFEHESIIVDYDCFDAIIRGEGETIIVLLCNDYFTNGRFTLQLDGVTYKCFDKKTLISQKVIVEENIDTIPFPIRDNQQNYPRKPLKYDGDNKLYVSISTSRGCPYGCAYCSVTNFRSKWEGRSPENVAEEAYALYKNYNDIFIEFADDNFYIDAQRSVEIIKKIREKCGEVIPFSFATRADQIINNGVDNLKFFKENGCYNIELGIENGSNTVLERFNKHITANQNKYAIEMIRQCDIHVAVDYILFDPETTVSELQQNVDFMKSANLFGYNLPLVYNRIKPYPGTNFTQKYGYISDPYYFKYKEVSNIYNCLQDFKDSYHNKITLILDELEVKIKTHIASYQEKTYYIWLTLLPYTLFELLVKNSNSCIDVYKRFLVERDVNEMINRISEECLLTNAM